MLNQTTLIKKGQCGSNIINMMQLKNLWTVALILLTNASIFAQTRATISGVPDNTSADITSVMVIDSALYKVSYRLSYIPNEDAPQNIREAQTTLLIGKRHSIFTDYHTLLMDSLKIEFARNNTGLNEQMAKLLPLNKGVGFKPIVVSNYPIKNSYTFQQSLGSTLYCYTDNGVQIEWLPVSGGEKVIQGYTCNKAVCHYRGRDYQAWYAPSVALSEGPYVFKGLPGLIFEVRDSNNEYVFELIGLEGIKENYPMLLSNRNLATISRSEFRKMEENLAKNPAEGLRLLSGSVSNPESLPKINPRPYNPIEKE
jgi:Protein of unknown function (Porph_ging).